WRASTVFPFLRSRKCASYSHIYSSRETTPATSAEVDHLGSLFISITVRRILFIAIRPSDRNYTGDGNAGLRSTYSDPAVVWLLARRLSVDGRRLDHAPKLWARYGVSRGGRNVPRSATGLSRSRADRLGDRRFDLLETGRCCCRWNVSRCNAVLADQEQ